MRSCPCITDFKTPDDYPLPWAHCTGTVNVTVRGTEWSVNFDGFEPDVSSDDEECTSSWLWNEIVNKAIKSHDED